MISQIHNNDIEDVFQELLICSTDIDRYADKFERIAILVEKCKEEFPEIICSKNKDGINTYEPSQIKQLVEDRKSIRLQRRGNHPHRQQSYQPRKRTRHPKPDDDDIVDGEYVLSIGYRFSHCLPPGTSKEIYDKFSSGTLTKKELRGERDRLKEQYEKEEQQRQTDDGLFDNNGTQYCKRYDPRIDATHPRPRECMNELAWLLDPDNEKIKIDNDYLDAGDGTSTIVKPIEAHHVIKSIKEGNECFICQFEDNNVGPDNLEECFSSYTNNKYHPLHQHGTIMSSIYAKLKLITDDIHKQINNNLPLDTICKYIRDIVPQLRDIAMEIRSNIVILQGGYYSKLHAMKVATTHPKYSKERGDAIRHMVNNNRYVPSKSALDRLMKMEEDGQLVVDDEWNTSKGGRKRPSILLETERFYALVEHCEQPSRADVRARRRVMNDYEKAVDTCMEKTDEEMKEYIKKRGKSIAFDKFDRFGNRDNKWNASRVTDKMYADITIKKKVELEKKMGATKQNGELQPPPRDIQMKQLKAQLKDEIPELKSPVQIPPYINDMLSDLCGSEDITSEQVKTIKHILTSELKTNDDNVFRMMKNIKGHIERDIEEYVEYQRKKKLSKGQFVWRPPSFKPVEYVRQLVTEANNREQSKLNKIRQHNKEIHAKMGKLLKEEQEEQEEQKKINKYKQQYKRIGSLVLALHPVKMEKPDESEHYKVYQFQCKPLITTALYAPPKLIEVCNKLGLSGERLYFNPRQFPVTNVAIAGDNDTFQQLKQYIVNQSSVAGNSPVVFEGTNSGCKRFICKCAHCKFSFSVKWDRFGYYIHTSRPNPTYTGDHSMIDRKCVVGCEFHNH